MLALAASRILSSARASGRGVAVSQRASYAAVATVSGLDQEEAMDALVDWFTASGGTLDGAEPDEIPGAGWGLVASRRLEAGEEILRVPPGLQLRLDAATGDERALRLASAVPPPLWPARLAVALLAERARGVDSRFRPYVDSLPASVPVPAFFSPTAVAALQYAPLRAQVKRRARWLIAFAAERLGTRLSTSQVDPFDGVTVDAAGFAWAWAACSSRAFRLAELAAGDERRRRDALLAHTRRAGGGGAGPGTKAGEDADSCPAGVTAPRTSGLEGDALETGTLSSPPQGNSFGPGDADLGDDCGHGGGHGGGYRPKSWQHTSWGPTGHGVPAVGGGSGSSGFPTPASSGALLPVLDLANHSPRPNARVAADADGTACLLMLQDVEEGEEVTISYGPLGNDTLLLDYGFVVRDNPHDTLDLRFDPGLLWLAQRAAGVRPPTPQAHPAAPWHLYRLAGAGVKPGMPVSLRRDAACPFPPELLAAARILVAASPAELGDSDPREGPASDENERAAVATLTGLCSLVLRHLPGSPADDLRTLTGTLPDDERLAVRFRIEKKHVLANAMQWAARRLHEYGGDQVPRR